MAVGYGYSTLKVMFILPHPQHASFKHLCKLVFLITLFHTEKCLKMI